MFECVAEQGALWLAGTKSDGHHSNLKKEKRGWNGVTQGEIGRDDKSEEIKIQIRQQARNPSHSVNLAVITLTTTHVKWKNST